jgi:hypothetical protein
MRFFAVLLITIASFTSPARAAPAKVAIFDVELLDTSLEGETQGKRADEAHRLAMVGAELRRLLTESGQIDPVDTAPAAARMTKERPLTRCNGCAVEFARDLGAQWAVSGFVQKTSNLILSMRVDIIDVSTEKVVRAGTVDIRGNTDEMWLRGIRWLAKNRLLDPPLPQVP